MKLGKIELDKPVMLAPMAGVTDLSFRLLCRENGCDFMTTEMVSAKAILYKNQNTNVLMERRDAEGPVALQLFGSDPDIMADIACQVQDLGFAAIDVNMGCPVNKIVNNGEGSALMKDPVLAGRIIEKMTGKLSIPVTVKFRKGFGQDSVNAVEFAHVMEESGASMITLHGRTRDEFYSGKADWDIIAEVVNSVKIPVIGNGDIFSAADAVKMFEQTGCAGIAVGRGAKGNPWIFREIKAALCGDIIPPRPTMEEIKLAIRKQAALMLEYKPEYIVVREMRKHVAWYTGGLHGCTKLRAEVNHCESLGELDELLERSLKIQ